eukprot:scaffold11853_cov49-Prasinocladus_malaysianus.AAC.1
MSILAAWQEFPLWAFKTDLLGLSESEAAGILLLPVGARFAWPDHFQTFGYPNLAGDYALFLVVALVWLASANACRCMWREAQRLLARVSTAPLRSDLTFANAQLEHKAEVHFRQNRRMGCDWLAASVVVMFHSAILTRTRRDPELSCWGAHLAL